MSDNTSDKEHPAISAISALYNLPEPFMLTILKLPSHHITNSFIITSGWGNGETAIAESGSIEKALSTVVNETLKKMEESK